MAASRRKAKAPRMDPITKERRSGSWADSSPEEPATQDHRWARPCVRTHPPIHRADSQRSVTRSLRTVSTLEGSGRGCKAWKAPGSLLTTSVSPRPSRLPLTLRQRLEVDLAPVRAVA